MKLGEEFTDIMHYGNIIQMSYVEFQDKVIKITSQTNKNPDLVKKILKNDKWTDQDIEKYPEWAQDAHDILGYTLRLFSDALMTKYSSIISRFDLNELAKSILVKIVTDALANHLLSRPPMKCPKCGAINVDQTHIFDEFNPGVFDLIGDFDLTNKFVDSEIKSLLKALILMMAPPRKYLERRIEDENKVIGEVPDGTDVSLKARIGFYQEILALN